MKTTYRIYALPLNEANIKATRGCRFTRTSAGHILVYSPEPIPNGKPLTDRLLNLLSNAEVLWITEANNILALEYAIENRDSINDKMYEFMERWEEQLKGNEEQGNTVE